VAAILAAGGTKSVFEELVYHYATMVRVSRASRWNCHLRRHQLLLVIQSVLTDIHFLQMSRNFISSRPGPFVNDRRDVHGVEIPGGLFISFLVVRQTVTQPYVDN
jgi:hypothetical protein